MKGSAVVTTAFDTAGAVCTAVAAALFVMGMGRPAGAVFAAGVVLLAWSWVWVGAPGAGAVVARVRGSRKGSAA